MAELTAPDWEELARDLSKRVADFAPDWTDPVGGDPGVTIVELFGFLAEYSWGRPDGFCPRSGSSPRRAGAPRAAPCLGLP